MRTIQRVLQRIQAEPRRAENQVLADLIAALQNDHAFALDALYALAEPDFDIALSLLSDWRLDRYCYGRAKPFDFSQSTDASYSELKWKA